MQRTTPFHLQDGWPIAGFAEANLDPKAMAGLARWVNENHAYHNTHAVLVESAGHLVFEVYLEGEDELFGEPLGHRAMGVDSLHDLRSVTKSVTSLLLGIALQGNYEPTLDTPVTELFKDQDIAFANGTDKVTLRHVLTMTAGFEWDRSTPPWPDPRNDNYQLYALTEDPVALILSRPLVATPGETMNYCDGLTEVLSAAVEQIVGKPINEYIKEVLFQPLGIDRFEWIGPPNWKPEGRPSAAAGLRLRARDLAKIGSMVMHNGVWKGQQIVPAEWLRLSVQPFVLDAFHDFRGTYGYGYQWWPGRSNSIPAYQIVAGFGLGGQQLLIIPERQLSVTIFAGNYNRKYASQFNWVLNQVASAYRRPL